MKSFILFLWQLPQNILGLLVILFTGAKCTGTCWVVRNPDNTKYFGVSLGNYIIFGNYPDKISCKHEQGHQKQSLYLGWLYLIIIGLPSFLGNIFDKLFHKTWSVQERIDWYYDQPWEKWADKLGKVKRYI